MSRIAASAALALAASAAFAATACGSSPVSPLPGQSPAATPTRSAPATPAPTATRTAGPAGTRTPGRPTARPPVRPSPTPTRQAACLGAVVYEVNASGQDPLPGALCLTVGAVLRVQNIGPDAALSVDPESAVSRFYEAGVIEIRFMEVGTVRVNIPVAGRTHTIRVLVVA